jgi:hypothetical protein
MHPVAERPLSRAVVEIERHMSASGWDQPTQLFALVPTAELLAAGPGLAAQLGADAGADLTPVVQEGLPAGADDEGLAGALARIEWPDAVTGCAVAVERVVLPAEAEEPADAYSAARNPRRHEVRMVAGVLRDGERFGAVRLRSHDEDDAVLTGTDLVPTLCEVLALTFAPGDGEDGPMAGAGDPDGTADGEESQR